MIDVSVILPCYNGARWISRAVESILDQTCKNFELVIIDDGSTDDSKTIIAPYLEDERIRYIYQDNRGFSAAINRGIKESNGIFIGFIGQDDLWIPTKLESQLRYISDHKNIDLVHSNYYSIDSKERIIGMTKAKTPDFSRKEEVVKRLFLDNFIGFETVLVKRKCFDEVGFFDERMIGCSDHDMWLRIAGSYNIGYLGLSLVKKREHGLQLTKIRKERLLKDEFLLIAKATDRYLFLKPVERKKLASLYHTLGLMLLQKGNNKEAEQELFKAMRCQPWKLNLVAACVAPTLYALVLNHYERFVQVHTELSWIEGLRL